MTYTVEASSLTKRFGDTTVLGGVDLRIRTGEIFALLGPNGAGKTTTVNILSTLLLADAGAATVAGFDLVTQPLHVRSAISLTGQYAAVDEVLTGRENLVMMARLRHLPKDRVRPRAGELLEQFDFGDAADRRVATYSGGMRRRLDLAMSLVTVPAVLFLDEPTTGLDPRSRQAIWELVTDFKEAGIATLLTTQYLEEADLLSDRIIVIDRGTVIAEGTADQLKERTGGTYCEIVPAQPRDIPAMARALGSLLPDTNRATLTETSDRISMPAPYGPKTLMEALHRLSEVR